MTSPWQSCSRKLLVFATATVLLAQYGLDPDTWGMIAIVYIGQSVIDAAKTWRHRHNDSTYSQKVLGTYSVLQKSLEAVVVLDYMAICYFYGKTYKEIKLDHDIAKAQWQKERDQIENSYQNEIEKQEKSRKAYEIAIKAAEEKKAKSTTALKQRSRTQKN